ncbi:MAG TPA: FAD-dependent oxidoreductase [Saprospiraceae bacterium]|nr:FAD-dependent oxidoreductase [Saprospiraceae bacterium]
MPLNYQWSHWEFDSFFKDIDFVVLGSGIVGLSTAIHLKQARPNARVLVLERGVLPIGASTRNAGFACFGSVSELLDDLNHTPEAEVWALVEERYLGLLALRELLGDDAIGYQQEGGFEVFSQQDGEQEAACLAAIPEFNRQLSQITARRDTFVTVPDQQRQRFGFSGVRSLIHNQAEGSIDTGKMMRSFLRKAQELDIQILNGCEVQAYTETTAKVDIQLSNGWTLSAGHLMIATNGFTNRLLPEIDLQPARNQVLITRPIPDLSFRGCFHYDRGYYYFRNVGQRVLLGGGRHLDKSGETTADFGANETIRRTLVELLEKLILPGQSPEVERWWTGILGVSQQKRPIIQRLGDRVSVAVRMGGMGVAIGTLVGKKAAERALQH